MSQRQQQQRRRKEGGGGQGRRRQGGNQEAEGRRQEAAATAAGGRRQQQQQEEEDSVSVGELTELLVRIIARENETKVRDFMEGIPSPWQKLVVDAASGDFYCTPLIAACIVGSLSILRYLLDDLHADPNVPREDGATPLHIAIVNQAADISLLDALLQAGADVNACSSMGDTPLHSAVRRKSLDHVKRLVERGAEVDATEYNPTTTPLLIAAFSNQTDVAAYLLSKGADPNKAQNDAAGSNPLYAAALMADLAMVNLLLDSGADPFFLCNRGYSTLMSACDSPSMNPVTGTPLETAKRLLDIGVSVHHTAYTKDGLTAIYLAASHNLGDVIAELVARGADVNAPLKGKFPLIPSGVTPLQIAAQKGCADSVSALIKAGANVNSQDSEGTTPLITACRNGGIVDSYKLIIEELINAGASKQVINKLGETPQKLAKTWLNRTDPLWKLLVC